jgi:hypothetical protein
MYLSRGSFFLLWGNIDDEPANLETDDFTSSTSYGGAINVKPSGIANTRTHSKYLVSRAATRFKSSSYQSTGNIATHRHGYQRTKHGGSLHSAANQYANTTTHDGATTTYV